MSHQNSLQLLVDWFGCVKRPLPWRDDRTPYRVFVSEVMLQQTQAATVIPYFLSWMNLFPSVADLAAATEEEVIKAWEGLGYYSRARRLHAASKMVVDQFGGEFPKDPDQLKLLPGMGPYTHAAVRAFAFQEKALALDGNVARVLTRFFGHFGDLKKQSVWKDLREQGGRILPEKDGWIVSEALIELGATVCKKKPECALCPLKESCEAYKNGWQEKLPVKSDKTIYQNLERLVLAITWKNKVYVKKADQGVMQGLFEFPFIELLDTDENLLDMAKERVESSGSMVADMKALPIVKHSFTRFRVKLLPFHVELSEDHKEPPGTGYTFEEVRKFAFSSGHRRVLAHLIEESSFA